VTQRRTIHSSVLCCTQVHFKYQLLQHIKDNRQTCGHSSSGGCTNVQAQRLRMYFRKQDVWGSRLSSWPWWRRATYALTVWRADSPSTWRRRILRRLGWRRSWVEINYTLWCMTSLDGQKFPHKTNDGEHGSISNRSYPCQYFQEWAARLPQFVIVTDM